ncbi:eukaryotic translation initiation factor 4B-like isoform X2 [Physella acuta]|uniref:eukaryotic translation initiation factor 4B-like isoform X2 n=1 Tax=Physella acuta TaxID=109671 RepID=UPI0027DC5AB4|nr:eukaryotic translation initiation factor 4B-like isoform X2 [Physella acuta]
MDTGGKKKKKEGKKTLTLDQFLAQNDGFSEPKSQNWALLSENPDDDYEVPIKFDRSTLPTAPKAAMGPKVDISQIPKDGPYSAYVGNISYDAKESDLSALFSKLEVEMVRIITDGGRPRGYAYVDFKNRESLLEALTYNEKEYMGRSIRVDLATEKNQEGRGGGGGLGGGRSNEPDRTEGDWRRREPASLDSSSRDSDRGARYGDRDKGSGGFDKERGSRGFSDRGFGGDRDRDRGFGDRDRDRGFGGDRDRGFGGDRERDRGFGDRDRGFGGDRDRGFGGDRDRDRGFGGDRDRDRGFGGDRGYGGDRGFSDRDRGGSSYSDRDRGYGGDRDRGYGGDRSSRGYGFNRDKEDGGRFGSRGGGSSGFEDRYGGRRDDNRREDFQRGRREDNTERPTGSRDGSQEHRDGPKERPVLNLKPRTKPVENKENQPAARSSIFGAAKPVDTYAREKQIEEKLKHKDEVDHSHTSHRRDSDSDRGRRSGDSYGGDNRRLSGERSAPISRRDSEHSYTSDDGGAKEECKSPSSVKSNEPAPKLVPAPPPKDNPWMKKKDGGALSSSSSNTSNVSNNAIPAEKKEITPPKPSNAWGDSKGRGRGGSARSDGKKPTDKLSQNGPPTKRPDISKSKPKEKSLPKSIDEMPKYEETKTKDFSDTNKFAYLNEDEDSGNEELS